MPFSFFRRQPDTSPFSPYYPQIRLFYERMQIPDEKSLEPAELLDLLDLCEQPRHNHDDQLPVRLRALLKYLEECGPRDLRYDFAAEPRTERPHGLLVAQALALQAERENEADDGREAEDEIESENGSAVEGEEEVEVDALRNEALRAYTRKVDLQRIIASQEEGIAALHSQAEELSEAFRGANKELAKWKKKAQDKIQDESTQAQMELNKATDDLECRRLALLACDAKMAQMSAEEARCKHRMTAMEAELRALEQAHAGMNDTLARLRRERDDRDAQISALCTANEKRGAECRKLASESSDLHARIASLESTISELRGKEGDLSAQIASSSAKAALHQTADASNSTEHAHRAQLPLGTAIPQLLIDNRKCASGQRDTSRVLLALKNYMRWVEKNGSLQDKTALRQLLATSATNLNFTNVQAILHDAQVALATRNVFKALQATWRACGKLREGVPALPPSK